MLITNHKCILLLLPLFLYHLSASAQNVQNHQVELKGVYAQINLKKDNEAIAQLSQESSSKLSGVIEQVEKNANSYIPPVLYVLSYILYQKEHYDDAAFWFYTAQLRARYDVNRCTDKTANAAEYNSTFGPDINKYSFKDTTRLKATIEKVVAYVSTNNETYDQRWINLSGMEAISVGLGSEPKLKELSLPKEQWPEIKAKTIKDYQDGLSHAIETVKNKAKQ